MADQAVTLQPGESKTVAFEVTPTVAKTYQVAVDGLTGIFMALSVAAFMAEILNASALWEGFANQQQIAFAWWDRSVVGYQDVEVVGVNEWPIDTIITTKWQVQNTGNKAATFTLYWMGQEGDIQLNPGESGWVEIACSTARQYWGGPGELPLTMVIYADGDPSKFAGYWKVPVTTV